MRSRIRTTYISREKKIVLKYLHGQDENKEALEYILNDEYRVLPVLALNEVSTSK